MKRRADDNLKQESTRCAAAYGHPPEGSLSASSHPPPPPSSRLLGSPPGVLQAVFKAEHRDSVVMPSSVTFPAQQSYSSTVMPGATNNSAVKVHTGSSGPPSLGSSTPGSSPMSGGGGGVPTPSQVQQFQRLKVEDALSYLDQVKFKFGNHPQVYNDFLDIMKEFKSQSIDTPGVIQRVSNLFKGHPELIVGFNTFLPPGYKIEVQSNDQGYAFQVSVSMPSPTNSSTTSSLVHSGQHHVVHPIGSAVHPGQSMTSVVTQGGTTVHTIPIGLQTQPHGKTNSMIILHGNQSTSSREGLAGLSSSAPAPSAAPAAPHHVAPPPASHYPPASSNNNNNNNSSSGGGGGVVSAGANSAAAAAHHNNSSHQHSAAHHAIAQAHQALSHGDGAGAPQQTQQSQPVEFNHAINYVNKIKNRFQGQPDKYKRFLEILHTYQKEQRNMKEGRSDAPGKQLTEAEVYAQVAKLFENQEDLLAEFGQFLPDATSHQGLGGGKGSTNDHSSIIKKSSSVNKPSYNNSCPSRDRDRDRDSVPLPLPSLGGGGGGGGGGGKFGHSLGQVKRSPSFSSGGGGGHGGPPPPKKQKLASLRDVTLAEAGKYGSLNDYAFFDKIRKGLKNQDVYENFLRCITLYNHEVVSKNELVLLVTPFLGKFPELFRWFKEFVSFKEESSALGPGGHHLETAANSVSRPDRAGGDLAMEIDYTACKRLGASYCALPKNHEHRKCTGRTPLCREVLNDTWVSFPTWSEDSTFVTCRKTQYEEYIYRCEDERFELDVVIETNAATIRVLEGVQKKMQRLSPEEMTKFRLDDCLGGFSPTIPKRALARVYGDKAKDIIEGLRSNPLVAVPVVVRRLKAKEEEWREAQKGFNKVWREQNEKYYLKSLDHQGINFKGTDVKALRSKSLFNEIETLFDERHEQAEETHEVVTGPHLVLPYKDKTIIADAANLLIHHVKRQTGVQKEDKQRIKQLLRQFVPDLFFHTRQELSDDEREDDDEKEDVDMEGNSNSSPSAPTPAAPTTPGSSLKREAGEAGAGDSTPEIKEEKEAPVECFAPSQYQAISSHPDESYIMFVCNNHWYIFLRLHQILCDRLTRMLECAVRLAADEKKYSQDRKESTAVALRLKPKSEIAVDDYYPAFLDMVRNVLDGNMDGNAYEDTLREMFGIHAYHAFTLDKVVTYAVRQLQHLVTDDMCQECVELLQQEQRRGGAGGACSTAHQRAGLEAAYLRRAENILVDENTFKVVVYKHDCKMTVELLETEVEEPDAPAEVDKWSTYVERYANSGLDGVGGSNESARAAEDTRDDEDLLDMSGEDADEVESLNGGGGGRRRRAIFLPRNVRLWKMRSGGKAHVPLLEPRAKDPCDLGGGGDGPRPAWRKDKVKEEREEGEDAAAKEKGSSSSDDEKPSEARLANPADGSAMIAEDNTQCKFNMNSYRIAYVVNKENYLYKRKALPKARETHPSVSLNLSGKFRRWHSTWAEDNVSDTQQKACADWLMGLVDGLAPNLTRRLTDNDLAKSPYRSYNRYRVTMQQVNASTSPAAKEETGPAQQ